MQSINKNKNILYIKTSLQKQKCIIVDLENYGDVVIFWDRDKIKALVCEDADITAEALTKAKKIVLKKKKEFKNMLEVKK